jgi:Tol biopolymer transport system component
MRSRPATPSPAPALVSANSCAARSVVFMSRTCSLLALALFLALLTLSASASGAGNPPLLVSTDSAGTAYAFHSQTPTISDDGRYIAFASRAPLTGADTNGVYVKDVQTGAVERADVSSAGVGGDTSAQTPLLSGDGRYVVFQSNSTNLDPLVTTNAVHIYRHDRQTGATQLVDVTDTGTVANNAVLPSSVSSGGRYVLFLTRATNLDPRDTVPAPRRSNWDLYLKDMQTGQLDLISLTAANVASNTGLYGDVTADGRYVAFQTMADLVPEDTNGLRDVYVKDRTDGSVRLVTYGTDGLAASGYTDGANDGMSVITPDGRYVLFGADVSAYSAEPVGGGYFRRDLQTGALVRIDKPEASGGQFNTSSAQMSNDGQHVSFYSASTTYGASSAADGIFTIDLAQATPAWARISVKSDGTDAYNAATPAISGNGLYVTFSTDDALIPADALECSPGSPHEASCYDVYRVDFQAGTPSGPPATPPGGTASFGNDDATPANPVAASVTTPVSATVTFTVNTTPAGPPAGYSFFGSELQIDTGGVTASPASPFVLTFVVDAATLGTTDSSAVQIFRDGVVIADCSPTAGGTATPDPCVNTRGVRANDDAVIVVLSSHASRWDVGKQLDVTSPSIVFGAHPVTYTVDQQVTFSCQVVDAGFSSGLASTTCANVNAPAYSFGLGLKTVSATAIDNAGNTGSGSTSFTVTVTPQSLCSLTVGFVKGSAKYLALPTKSRAAVDALSDVACQAVLKVTPKLTGNAKTGFITGYKAAVDVLQKSSWLTPAQQTTLKTLAAGL